MANLLRILSLVLTVMVILVWAMLGAHLGWSQTRVPTERVDPITEIKFTEYEDRFVPGVDFLAVGLAGSLGLGVIGSLLARKSQKNQISQPS